MDKDGFMCYIKNEFPTTVDTHWSWNLLENIIDYGIENKNYFVGQLENFLDEMIPEITIDEIKQFM